MNMSTSNLTLMAPQRPMTKLADSTYGAAVGMTFDKNAMELS